MTVPWKGTPESTIDSVENALNALRTSKHIIREGGTVDEDDRRLWKATEDFTKAWRQIDEDIRKRLGRSER